MQALDDGTLSLDSGSVTFVPVCNPQAFASDKRFVEQDLNRVFRPTLDPRVYEAALANDLCQLIKACDVFLDIHSTSAPGPMSVFVDYVTPQNHALAASVGAEYAILDWPAVYADAANGFDSYDTTRYAYEQGKTGIIIECGQHREPVAQERAKHALMQIFSHLDLTTVPPEAGTRPLMRSVRMTHLYGKEHARDSFTKEWSHLEMIPQGTCIAERATGERICADQDSVMILPKHAAIAGGEWFYIGINERAPD